MNLANKIFSYIKITRPLNVIITFLVVIVAILISESEHISIIIIFFASTAAAMVAASGNIINDIYDIETDKISHPNRVLVIGAIAKNEAWIEYTSLNIIAIIIAALISFKLTFIVVATIILLYFYSTAIKKIPLVGNFTIAFITGLTFVYGGVASGNLNESFIPAIFAFLINAIRELVKDIMDIDGDNKINIKTFPIRFGIPKSKQLITALTFLLIVFTFYPFLNQFYRIEYFIVVMVILNPILVVCLKFLSDKNEEKNLSNVSSLLKLNMIIGLIAIYVGK